MDHTRCIYLTCCRILKNLFQFLFQIDELNFGQLRKKNVFLAKDSSTSNETAAQPVQPKRPQSKIFGRVQKFKHLKGDVILKGRFENLKNLSKTMPAECNFVHGKFKLFKSGVIRFHITFISVPWRWKMKLLSNFTCHFNELI